MAGTDFWLIILCLKEYNYQMMVIEYFPLFICSYK